MKERIGATSFNFNSSFGSPSHLVHLAFRWSLFPLLLVRGSLGGYQRKAGCTGIGGLRQAMPRQSGMSQKNYRSGERYLLSTFVGLGLEGVQSRVDTGTLFSPESGIRYGQVLALSGRVCDEIH